jgi:RNase P protein component
MGSRPGPAGPKQDDRRPGDGRGTGARRRGPVASAHFVLTRRLPAPAHGALALEGDILLMAVPKRLLKRAVDRNTLRRIAREAWRARTANPRPRTPALLRLARRPAGFETLTQRARKRLWREELDDLLARDAECVSC